MRIILADHHPNVLLALNTILSEKTRLQVIGQVADANNLIALALDKSPDLVLIDSELPGQPIAQTIAALHLCRPRPVVIAMSSKPELGRKLLQAGADVFVSKTDQVDWLIETLQKYDTSSQTAIVEGEENHGN